MARAPATQDVEAPPEADRLEPYPHPRHTIKLFGHDALEKQLADNVQAGRVHHAWLLTGPEGIGKATLGWRFARYLLAGEEARTGHGLNVDPTSPAARQVAALSHPSLLLIRRPWDHTAKRFPLIIPVEEVRRIKGFLAHSGEGTGWRVVVVDRADELNISAANALLKSLEEPPRRVVFVLISSMPGRLLPTIRSRCRTLEMAPLAASDLAQAASAARSAAHVAPLSDADITRLAPLAKGSPRRLLALADTGGGEIYDQIMGLLATLPRLDRAKLHAFADQLTASGAEVRYQAFLELSSDVVAGLVRARATGETATPAGKLAHRLMGQSSPARLAEAWEQAAAMRAETEALNLDRKALVVETFGLIEKAIQG